MNLLTRKILGSIVRQLLTGLGAVLVAKGLASEEVAGQFAGAATDIVMGVVIALASSGWSFRKHQETVANLRELQPGTPDAQLVRPLPNIAKGRAGSCPLTIVLLLATISSLVACATSSAPSECVRELTVCKISLEACVAK